MEAYGLLVIILGILLIVFQFYVEYESSGALDHERIAKYKEQKDKGELSLYGRIDLNSELFIKSRILYKIGAILICIGIICIVMIYKVIY
ncbi:hypothetical protein [Aliarcobacter butzleri]|uniref:hypothetical protein n=1 Tax=Aliarcobacter butzleri TaxID=28197 RepID=UPI0021B38BD9|nr:hypothetical protein [Aliarcobacter butzleri]MCT7618831.1 hypothetical protein [Aliarcobacter butzleri]